MIVFENAQGRLEDFDGMSVGVVVLQLDDPDTDLIGSMHYLSELSAWEVTGGSYARDAVTLAYTTESPSGVLRYDGDPATFDLATIDQDTVNAVGFYNPAGADDAAHELLGVLLVEEGPGFDAWTADEPVDGLFRVRLGSGETIAGPSRFDELDDVDATGGNAPTDGQAPLWDDVEQKWIPGDVTGGSSLPDQTGHDGKILRTDGTDPQWANLGLVIADAPSKVTPGDNDKFAISDSDASDVVKRVAFADLVAALPAGSGDVVGPASATNNSLARFDGTTGKLLKDGAVIGTDVQAYHANLAAVAGLSLVADRLPYANGTGTLALATFTSFGRTLAALSNSAALMADLSGQAGADFSLNTHKLTGLAPGTADTDAANVGQTHKRQALITDSATRFTNTDQGTPLSPMEASGVTTTAVTAGQLYWWIFDTAEPGTITSFQFSVTATGLSSGQTVDVAMFDIAADNGPGTRLWNQSVTVGNTTGTKRVTGLSLARPTRGALAFINPSGNAGSVTVLMAVPSATSMWALGTYTANRTAMVRTGVSAMPSDLTSSNFTIGGSDFLTQAVPLILGRA